jgi:dihydroorotate dehydrogenase electron transfer subunit
MVLDAPAIAKKAQPGNFMMVRVCDGGAPLLRRPLGVHRVYAGSVELLYEVVGPGTDILSQKKTGQQVDVIGPLGNGFSVDSRAKRGRSVLVAGGMGVAPLFFLAERIHADRATVLIGAATSAHILCAPDFKKLGCDVRIATDDGSAGFHGYVTGLLEELLEKGRHADRALYGCGPKPMLKAMAGLCRRHDAAAQVSLEAHMACGIGACLGCVVQTKQGLKRVCKEGPVFQADDVIW